MLRLSKTIDWKNIAKRFWVSCFVAFLFLRLTLAEYWAPDNRFYLHWTGLDTLGLMLVVVIFAIMIFVAYVVGGRIGRHVEYVRDVVYSAFVLFCLKVALVEIVYPVEKCPVLFLRCVDVCFLLLVAVGLLCRRRVRVFLDTLCVVFSPVVVIYFAGLIFSFSSPVEDYGDELMWLRGYDNAAALSDVDSDGNISKILILVFDATTYSRVFRDKKVMERLPGFARMSKKSIVFHKAYSAGNSTLISMPGFITGVAGEYSIVDMMPYVQTEEDKMQVPALPTLFSDMKQERFDTALIGGGLPYKRILSQEGLDWCQQEPNRKPLIRLISVAKNVIVRHVGRRFGEKSILIKRICSRMTAATRLETYNWMHKHVLVCSGSARKSFVVAHYMVPHYPYICDANGLIDVDDMWWGFRWQESGYMGNLEYADRLLDEVLDAVEKSGEGNRSMIVVMADHACRSDPEVIPDDMSKKNAHWELSHVPLMIRLPGQNERRDVASPFSLLFLRDILGQYVHNKTTLDSFVRHCGSFDESDIDCRVNLELIWR